MRFLLAAALICPTGLFAAGGGDETAPPKPTKGCTSGEIYDDKTGTCKNAFNDHLDADEVYQGVRQLAYAGRYHDAQMLLAALPENDDRRLTYMGFTHRKLGNAGLADVFYSRAIARNPGNILARSYMGQGMVEAGDVAGAMGQLRAIRAQGGTGTWAETSLRNAIATGTTYSY